MGLFFPAEHPDVKSLHIGAPLKFQKIQRI